MLEPSNASARANVLSYSHSHPLHCRHENDYHRQHSLPCCIFPTVDFLASYSRSIILPPECLLRGAVFSRLSQVHTCCTYARFWFTKVPTSRWMGSMFKVLWRER